MPLSNVAVALTHVLSALNGSLVVQAFAPDAFHLLAPVALAGARTLETASAKRGIVVATSC